MSGTGKRGPDYLNTIGIITVGICGSVLTYVSIVLLTAFYMTDTSQIERQKAFEGEGSLRNNVEAAGIENLSGHKEGTISIEKAIELVARDAQKPDGRSNLVPGVGPLTKPTVVAEYGRPVDLPSAPAAPATEPATPTDATQTPATTPATTPDATQTPATDAATQTPATDAATQTPATKTDPQPTAEAPATAPAGGTTVSESKVAPKTTPKKPAPKKTGTGTGTGAPKTAPGGNGP